MRPIKIVSLVGIPILVHPSWFLLLGLVTWILAGNVFPSWLEGRSDALYFAMAVATVVFFFGSIILHELAHSLVAAGGTARLTDLPAVTGPEQAIWAVTNCAYMRNRFTAVDLLIALGWWRSEDVDEVLSRAEYEVEEAETSHAPR